jgi:hypothetical protein
VFDHLERVRGSTHAGHPFRAEDRLEQCRGRGPVGRHEALGEGHDSRAVGYAEALEFLDGRADFLGGNSQQQEVGSAELVGVGAEGAHPQVPRELHAGQVAHVLTRA